MKSVDLVQNRHRYRRTEMWLVLAML